MSKVNDAAHDDQANLESDVRQALAALDGEREDSFVSPIEDAACELRAVAASHGEAVAIAAVVDFLEVEGPERDFVISILARAHRHRMATEVEVLREDGAQLLAEGKRPRQVAKELGVTEATLRDALQPSGRALAPRRRRRRTVSTPEKRRPREYLKQGPLTWEDIDRVLEILVPACDENDPPDDDVLEQAGEPLPTERPA